MEVKEESAKADSKLNVKNAKIMSSDPICSWQIEGEKVEAVTDFLLEGSKITADGYSSHEIKSLLLRRKAMTNRPCIKKQRHDITVKIHIFKSMVLPVVMKECENWTLKRTEHRIYAFEL